MAAGFCPKSLAFARKNYVLPDPGGCKKVIAVMEHHVTATECHLPYGKRRPDVVTTSGVSVDAVYRIATLQCYLLPDTSERTPPSPQPVRPILDLPTREG